MFDQSADRPQSCGDLIGRSVRTCRQHLPLIFKSLIIPTIVALAGAVGAQYSFPHLYEHKASEIPAYGLIFGASLSIILVAKWILTIRQLALVRFTSGFAESYEESHRWLSARKWAVLLLCAAGFGAAVLVAAGWMIEIVLVAQIAKGGSIWPAIGGLGLLVAVPGFTLSTGTLIVCGFIACSILSCEQISVSNVINKAFKLTWRDFWRSVGFGLLVYLVITCIALPLSMPLVVISAFDAYQRGLLSGGDYDPYKMPLHLMVISHAWEGMLGMILWSIAFVSFGYFYYDLRVRQEGLDIRRQLEVLEGGAS